MQACGDLFFLFSCFFLYVMTYVQSMKSHSGHEFWVSWPILRFRASICPKELMILNLICFILVRHTNNIKKTTQFRPV
jgi:hypothetical protein